MEIVPENKSQKKNSTDFVKLLLADVDLNVVTTQRIVQPMRWANVSIRAASWVGIDNTKSSITLVFFLRFV